MENKAFSGFSESGMDTGGSEDVGHMRCKSLYDEWKSPAYYPYHSYQKNKAKSVSLVVHVLSCPLVCTLTSVFVLIYRVILNLSLHLKKDPVSVYTMKQLLYASLIYSTACEHFYDVIVLFNCL